MWYWRFKKRDKNQYKWLLQDRTDIVFYLKRWHSGKEGDPEGAIERWESIRVKY